MYRFLWGSVYEIFIQSIRPRTAVSPSIQSVSHITSRHGDNLLSPWHDVMFDTLFMQGEVAVRVFKTVYLKHAPKWTSAGRKDVISLPLNRAMCKRFQVIKYFKILNMLKFKIEKLKTDII